MWWRRRDLVAVLFVAVACAAVAAPVALAAREVVIADHQGPFVNAATDPDTGRSVAIMGSAVPDGVGASSLELFASAVDRRGHSSGPAVRIGGGMKIGLTIDPSGFVNFATDSRRGRQLAAWAAYKPGMGLTACVPTFGTGSPCLKTDTEIFVRLLSRTGRTIGVERQVTSIGPPARGDIPSSDPRLAYDAKSDSYLLVFTSRVTGDDIHGALFAQRLRSDGTPLSAPRLLALQPQPLSVDPQARLVADARGGYLLAYTWGDSFAGRRLYTRRLTAKGRPVGPTASVADDAVGGLELAMDARRRALVVYSPAAPGEEGGVRARLLSAGGRPLARAVALPYRLGRGLAVVTADPSRDGWVYGFVREGKGIFSSVLVQRATSTGRPAGAARQVSQPDRSAFQPRITAVRGGAIVAVWAEDHLVCQGDTCTSDGVVSARMRSIRP